MPRPQNPLEVMVEELSDAYVALVNRLVDEIAPVGPWWEAGVSADGQLWRWEGTDTKPGPRGAVLAWLMQAGIYMGWKDAAEVLKHIEEIFTSPHAPDVIPPDLIADPAKNEGLILLLEMGQSAGWHEMAVHIRRMEVMHANRLEALALLKNTDQPRIPLAPAAPPPQPTDLIPGEPGWPGYGGVPQDPASGHGTPSASRSLSG